MKKSRKAALRRKRKRKVVTASQLADRPDAQNGVRRIIDRAAERAQLEAVAYVQTVRDRAERQGVSEAIAKKQESGHELGILARAGKLGDTPERNQDRLEAGLEFAQRYNEYQIHKGLPSPNPRAADYQRKDGYGEEPDCAESARQARDRFDKMIVPILSMKNGHAAYELLKRVAVENESTGMWTAHMFDLLRQSLGAVDRHMRGLA